MKTLFIIKYIGKTFLIMCAVLAMGRIAVMGYWFNSITIFAAAAYCYGSIEYQTLRRKKSIKIKAI